MHPYVSDFLFSREKQTRALLLLCHNDVCKSTKLQLSTEVSPLVSLAECQLANSDVLRQRHPIVSFEV